MQENLLQASNRHLKDAELLYLHDRFDNSLYLTAYSVECLLKFLIDHYTRTNSARSYNHNIKQLNDAFSKKLLVVYPQLSRIQIFSSSELEILSAGHPERRYWASNFANKAELSGCLSTTKDFYRESISSLLLDGVISINEV